MADQLLALGQKTSTKGCAPFHGLDGHDQDQDDLAYLLFFNLRDFVTRSFVLSSCGNACRPRPIYGEFGYLRHKFTRWECAFFNILRNLVDVSVSD